MIIIIVFRNTKCDVYTLLSLFYPHSLFSRENSGVISKNTKCGGPDSNRRIPTETDLESVAFNLARQPPLTPLALLHLICFCFDWAMIFCHGMIVIGEHKGIFWDRINK